MALLRSKDKKTSITELLEDLTHLEINTIIKDGMLATPSKKSRYDLLRDIFDNYSFKYHQVLKAHDGIKAIGEKGYLEYKLGEGEYQIFKDSKVKPGSWGESFKPSSFHQLHVRLKSLNRIIHIDEELRLSTSDYTILRRVASFCEYLFTLRKDVAITQVLDTESGDKKWIGKKLSLYDTPIIAYKFELELETADEVKIKRMRDLGTETIVMQTRIGIDGDVITRIERDFAETGGSRSLSETSNEATKNTIIALHEKHIDISVKYWNSLVNMVKDFVSGLIDNKS